MGFCLDTSLYDWLYFSVFAVAWFLLGFMTKHYVSTITKLHDVGTTARKIPVDTEDGMATMAGSNSHLEPGKVWLDWDFPRMPRLVNKSTVPTASINVMGILGGNGLTVAVPVD